MELDFLLDKETLGCSPGLTGSDIYNAHCHLEVVDFNCDDNDESDYDLSDTDDFYQMSREEREDLHYRCHDEMYHLGLSWRDFY